MWSAIAALKGVWRVRQSETKWRLFGFLKRTSTSEHGIAGHDRLALSVRSWSSCSIAAMRRLKSENIEPRVLLAPLAVLSPGPRLAGSPHGAWKWHKMALGTSFSNGFSGNSRCTDVIQVMVS